MFMPGHLVGESMFRDTETSLIVHGGLALRSDGQSRSEIEITDFQTGHTETMTFTGSRWMLVYQLILLIREQFSAYALVDEGDDEPGDPCPQCDGLGMYEDAEGNWPDCELCVP